MSTATDSTLTDIQARVLLGLAKTLDAYLIDPKRKPWAVIEELLLEVSGDLIHERLHNKQLSKEDHSSLRVILASFTEALIAVQESPVNAAKFEDHCHEAVWRLADAVPKNPRS